MIQISFEEAVQLAVSMDDRYPADAYFLVREALDYSVAQRKKELEPDEPLEERVNQLEGENIEEPRTDSHVTGPQLCEGFRVTVLENYGPLAPVVLAEFKLTSTIEIGQIVYNLIEIGAFGKREEDALEDFADVYDFDEVFRVPFLPPSERAVISTKNRSAGTSREAAEADSSE